ncbi:hypothetical protein [Dyadobacter frigoris]|uniref:Oxidoreductase FAD/NAD(P)-binding domain-containing protein n=1 Tax=Dyadobacter frigoris TaxID=2576211 RepID=A0A4U6CPY2_9BACT|nr:hypothetical protein [Dyadobacter frigoris]TKT86542.1 hypothetical protein FDK13_32195 [Dyadobacter frigoris]
MDHTQHHIFVTDETGIAESYQNAKNRLVQHPDDHVSLLFFAENNDALFSREMTILHNHFPERFLVYDELLSTLHPGVLPQETLESVINENTRDEMSFFITGETGFRDLIRRSLVFLGIDTQRIASRDNQSLTL